MVYINVCSSDVVEDQMTAVPNSPHGLGCTLPYIVGDLREDANGSEPCLVLEVMFNPTTLERSAASKQTQQAVITTAVNVVSENVLPLRTSEWALFEPEMLKEVTGCYFFAPGKLRNDDLDGVE